MLIGRSQQYEKALADTTRVIELESDFEEAYLIRGEIYTILNQYKAALADFNRVIELNPKHARAYATRGNIYFDLEQYDEALADYNQSIALEPNNAQVHLKFGGVLASRRALREALPSFEKAAQLGSLKGAQLVAAFRRKLGIESNRQEDPIRSAIIAFLTADSLAGMRQAVAEFPFMTAPGFIAVCEQSSNPENERALKWLRRIARDRR